MSAKHTPGPIVLTIYRHPDGALFGRPYLYAPQGPSDHQHVAELCYDMTASLEVRAMQEANMKRLAQCWNNYDEISQALKRCSEILTQLEDESALGDSERGFTADLVELIAVIEMVDP